MKPNEYPQYPHALLLSELHKCQAALVLVQRDILSIKYWQPHLEYIICADTKRAIAAALSGIQEEAEDER